MSSANECRALVVYKPPTPQRLESTPPPESVRYIVSPALLSRLSAGVGLGGQSPPLFLYKTPSSRRWDLQKGECNPLFSDSIAFKEILKRIAYVATYDIVCQWNLQLHTSGEGIERPGTVDSSSGTFFQGGGGHTDGEPIETAWAAMNPVYYCAREMGPGKRHESL
ncbi:hypothetical protein B0H11DRAFT_2229109 [Mycena galericulata]|nr:hypothetical protein B0H11DRAFT_2229109 [Mycena galericulata]